MIVGVNNFVRRQVKGSGKTYSETVGSRQPPRSTADSWQTTRGETSRMPHDSPLAVTRVPPTDWTRRSSNDGCNPNRPAISRSSRTASPNDGPSERRALRWLEECDRQCPDTPYAATPNPKRLPKR